jgi:hypothetical protein
VQSGRDAGSPDRKPSAAAPDNGTRPQKGGEAETTRFGMEEGDNTDVPATGLDPDQQSNPGPE